MAYDEALAGRVRDELTGLAAFEEKKMFGGLAFIVNTHMACGIVGGDLMVRVGKAGYEDALASGSRELEFTGRPMRGLVTVAADEVADPAVLERWVMVAAELALSEAAKPAKVSKPGGG